MAGGWLLRRVWVGSGVSAEEGARSAGERVVKGSR